MNRLELKFKNRQPEETIKIISDFFAEKGYHIEIVQNKCTEAKTWWCSILLWYNNNKILTSNGKGETEQYSLASGFSELYERFCSYLDAYYHPILLSNILKENYNKNKYYFSAEEKFVDKNNINKDLYINKLLKIYTEEELNNYYKLYTNNIFNDNICFIPFLNLETNKREYYEPLSIINSVDSNGLASGNTIEEAIIQSTCELYERLVFEKLLYEEQQNYYELNLNIISNNLKQIINNIINKNNTVHIYDLSYNFNFPVILIIVINHISNHVYYNIASSFSFEIALERCLTELYQGIEKTLDISYTIMGPKRNFDISGILEQGYHHPGNMFVPFEEVLLNSKITNQINYNCFLYNLNISDKEIINYINKINKENNIQMAWRDISLSDNIFAIQNIITNYDANPSKENYKLILKQNNNIDQKTLYIFQKNTINFLNSIINNEELDIKFISNFISKFSELYSKYNFETILEKFHVDIFIPFLSQGTSFFNSFKIIKSIIFEDDYLNTIDYNDSIYFNTYSFYIQILLYIYSNKYSNEEIKNIVEKIYKIKITNENIENIKDINLRFYLILLMPMINIYESKEYSDFIKTLIK